MMVEVNRDDIRDELPRVSVESFTDWQRIQSSVNDAALAILEEKLVESNMEGQRDILLPHIHHFLQRTFQIARPNLRVNGQNFDEYDEDEQDTDQFDEALDRRVWSLSDQRLKWDLEIGLKRSNTPRDVEALMRDLIETQRASDASAPSSRPVDADDAMDEDSRDELPSEAGGITIEMVKALQQDVPAQLDRAERMKEVDAEIRRLKT